MFKFFKKKDKKKESYDLTGEMFKILDEQVNDLQKLVEQNGGGSL